MSCAPALWAGVGPPSLAALATSSSVSNVLAVVGLRPPLKRSSCPPGCVRLHGVALRCASLLLPRSPASAARPGSVRSCKIKTRSCRCATEGRSVPCGPRQPAPGRRFTGPQQAVTRLPPQGKPGDDRRQDVARMQRL